jgi:hypothetical protein
MRFVKNELIQYKEEKKNLKAHQICSSWSKYSSNCRRNKKMIFKSFRLRSFYNNLNLKRVFTMLCAGFYDVRLPAIGAQVPLVRENRFYQAIG